MAYKHINTFHNLQHFIGSEAQYGRTSARKTTTAEVTNHSNTARSHKGGRFTGDVTTSDSQMCQVRYCHYFCDFSLKTLPYETCKSPIPTQVLVAGGTIFTCNVHHRPQVQV